MQTGVFRRGLFRLHRWIGLLIGVQVAIWTGSGLFMALSPIEKVRGEYLVRRESTDPVALAQVRLTPAQAVDIAGGRAREISLKSIHRHPAYLVVRQDGGSTLLDARNGAVLSPLSQDLAREIAVAGYRGKGEVRDVMWLTRAPIEFRQQIPVWRVRFADRDQTAVYVDPRTGRISAVRTRLWRVYDFLWGLHILDWRGRENFNTPWLQIAASFGLVLALSGLWMGGGRFLARTAKAAPKAASN